MHGIFEVGVDSSHCSFRDVGRTAPVAINKTH